MAYANTSIKNEVLANSTGATGGLLTAVLTTGNIANTQANGSTYNIVVGGITPAIQFGSESNYPATIVAVAIGANGNAADPIIVQANIPPNPQTGAWTADFLVTLRGNGAGAGANANQVWSGISLNPLIPPITGAIIIPAVASSPATNGNVNVAMSSSIVANSVNISVLVAASTGQNANSLVESAIVFQMV
jgi:hypothetical protein